MLIDLSVIVCTYNNAELLMDCLSRFVQPSKPQEASFEVIVVDNNSKDETNRIVDCYIQSNTIPNLRYIFEPQPGLTNARLAGVRNATGSWIAFIDDDIRIQPDWIESALQFIKTHPKAGAIGGRIELQYLEPPTAAALKCEAALCKVDGGGQAFKSQQGNRAPLVGAAILFRQQALEETGWLSKRYLSDRTGKSLSSGGDTEMIMRVSNQGWEVWYVPTLCATHLIPPKRTTIAYLCQLHRGLARSSAQLRAIGLGRQLSPQLQIEFFWESFSYAVRRTFSWGFHDVLLHRTWGDKRLIQVFESLGRLESSIASLLHPLDVHE
jgi:glycosyltransferase involved in cell wall biosynthesis